MIRRATYFADKALGSVRESPGVSLLTATTIAVALIMVGGYAMSLRNLEGLARVWGRTASLAVYTRDGLGEAGWQALRAEILAREEVAAATLVTPREALARFKERGPEAAALVEGVAEDVLPASIEIDLAPAAQDLASLERLAHALEVMSGVREVDYGREEFERLRGLLDVLRYLGGAIGLVIALATAFIVSSTIRLTVYARRDEIAILSLVGATRWFIRAPFVLEAAMWGLGGGLAAAAALYAADELLAPALSSAVADVLGGVALTFFERDLAVALVLGGLLLGMSGSALAVRRFLDAEPG